MLEKIFKISLIVFCCLVFETKAEILQIIKSSVYYKRPSDDSLSCRKAAIFDLQTKLLSETYSLVVNRQSMNTTEQGSEYRENAEIILSGLLKMDIIYEEYDGSGYFIEAKILLDTSESRRQIEEILKNKELTEKLNKSAKNVDSLKTELSKLVAVGIDDDYSQQKYISLIDLIASQRLSFGEQAKISDKRIKSGLQENQFSYEEYIKQGKTVKVLSTNEISVALMSPSFVKYEWGKYLMFNILVVNISNKPILFIPDEIMWTYEGNVYDDKTGRYAKKTLFKKVISSDDYNKRVTKYKRRVEIWTSIAIGLSATNDVSLYLQAQNLDNFSRNMSNYMNQNATEYSQRNTIFANGSYYSYFLTQFSKKETIESVIVPINGKNFNFDFNGNKNYVK